MNSHTQPPLNAVPSDARMLAGIRMTLKRIAARGVDEFSRNALAAIDVVLNEMLSRQEVEFYRDFHARALQLLREGAALTDAPFSVDENLSAVLGAEDSFEIVMRRVNGLMQALAEAVQALRSSARGVTRDYFARLAAAEQELLAHGQQAAAQRNALRAARVPAAITRDAFESYCRKKFPQRADLRITQFRELTGGYQKTTILFETEEANGLRESMVIRAEKDDRFVTLDAGDIRSEYAIVRLAHAAGVSVAEPLWLEPDADVVGQRFFVSRKVDGQNLGTAVATEAALATPLVRHFVETLATIHRVPIGQFEHSPIQRWLAYPTLRANTLANVDYWIGQQWAAFANPSPLLTRLEAWLTDNVPQDEEAPCFIHGDFGLHNVLVDADRVSGVLDWEAARIGDPAEDLSWFLQSSGGKVDSAQALEWYRELTGRNVSEYRLRYYDVFNCMKILVGASCAAGMHEQTPDAAIEWCNIPFIWAPLMAAQVQAKIDVAEAARAR